MATNITNFPIQTNTITDLPNATLPLLGTDILEVVNGGVSAKATIADIGANFAPSTVILVKQESDFGVQFLRYTTKLYKDEEGNCCVEFPKWRFACPKPSFTSQEIEDCLKAEYVEAKTDNINNIYAEDETIRQTKLNELSALSDLEAIKLYEC